jgi:hypothetical protein
VLFVGINGAGASASGVTYNGNSLTKVVSEGAGTISEIWMIVNPDAGSNNVVVTWGSNQQGVVCGSISYTGVDSANPAPTTAVAAGSANNPSISITTQFSNSWILDSLAFIDSLTAFSGSPGSGQTQRYALLSAAQDAEGCGSDKSTTTAGSYSMSWSTSGSGLIIWNYCCIEIKAATIVNRVQGPYTKNGSSSPVNGTLTSTPTAGNILVAVISCVSTTAQPSVSSITQTGVTWYLAKEKQQAPVNQFYYQDIEIWIGVVGASPSASFSVAFNNITNGSVMMCEYNGILIGTGSVGSIMDASATNNGSSTTADTGTTGTPIAAVELDIGGILVGHTPSKPTNGFALTNDFTSQNTVYLEKFVSSKWSADCSVSNSSADWVGCMVTLLTYSFSVAGTTRDSSGNALGNCTVTLFRTSTNGQVSQVISSGSGAYSFGIGFDNYTQYWIWAYKSGSPDVFGVTDTNITGANG